MLEEIAKLLRGVLSIFRIRRPLHWYDTGITAVINIFKPGKAFKLLEIRFKTTALAAGEDLTITRTTLEGDAYYNVILFFEELGDTGTLDITMPFGPDEGFMTAKDSIVSALSANAGGDRWGMEIIYELV